MPEAVGKSLGDVQITNGDDELGLSRRTPPSRRSLRRPAHWRFPPSQSPRPDLPDSLASSRQGRCSSSLAIGNSHAPTSCLCTGRHGSCQVALPLVVPSRRLRRHGCALASIPRRVRRQTPSRSWIVRFPAAGIVGVRSVTARASRPGRWYMPCGHRAYRRRICLSCVS
jgi:hypothetical protein